MGYITHGRAVREFLTEATNKWKDMNHFIVSYF